MGRLSQTLRKRETTAAVIRLLAETWPAAFSVYEARRKPLAVGIHEPLLEALAGAVEPPELGRALGAYTCNAAYLRALAKPGAMRVGLDGAPVALVTAEDAASARALLEQARQKPTDPGGRPPPPRRPP
jgi:sRNA-binding protein